MSKCYNQMDNFWDNENNFLQNLKNEKFSFSRNQKLKLIICLQITALKDSIVTL